MQMWGRESVGHSSPVSHGTPTGEKLRARTRERPVVSRRWLDLVPQSPRQRMPCAASSLGNRPWQHGHGE